MKNEDTNKQTTMTNNDKIITAARQSHDTHIYYSGLLGIIKEIRDEFFDLLDDANTPDEKTRELRNLLNAAKATTEHVENVNKERIKILTEGKESDKNSLIYLYQVVNDAFCAIDYANQKDIEIKSEIESIAGERIYSNELKLKRAITNIYTYLDEKTKKGTITIGAEKLNDKIKIYVNATNQGIELANIRKLRVQSQESASMPKLDEPYMSLVSAKSIVEKLNGTFEIESDENKKTTISMYLNREEKQRYT